MRKTQSGSINKPKVLFVGALPPPVHGSAVVSQYIKASLAINEALCCDWVNLSMSRKMDEIGKNSLIKPFRFLGSLLKTIYYLSLNNYDLCYLAITCHGKGFLKDVPFVLLCKLFKKKIVIHQHNKGMSSDVNRWPYNYLLPLCYKNVKVILLSWNLYPDIERVVLKDNVIICPNGIPAVENDNKKRNNIVPHLLFLSNLISSKGVFVLLDALKILMDRGCSFICDFVGGETKDINAQRFAEEVSRRELNQLVVYHGKKYNEEKQEMFENADIFVFPTYYNNECFPLVLLEAMSHGLPCVTTDEGGIVDLVEDGRNGYIVESCNSEDLANKIFELINNEDRRIKMGYFGLKRYYEKYTLDKFEKRLCDILTEEISKL